MISGLPRSWIAGSAKLAPAAASLRISGNGLISDFIGMKPATIIPGLASASPRAAIASAAAARSSAGSASRLASAAARRSAFWEVVSGIKELECGAAKAGDDHTGLGFGDPARRDRLGRGGALFGRQRIALSERRSAEIGFLGGGVGHQRA